MSVISVSKDSFENEVMQSEKPVLLDFWAAWCGPCKAVSPILEEIASENSDIKVCKVNVDEEAELATRFGIMSIPTLMVIKNGRILQQAAGARSKAQIISMIHNA